MRFSVSDLVCLEEMVGAKVIAGSRGLGRDIDYVDIWDSLPNMESLKPNNLIIVSEYAVSNLFDALRGHIAQLCNLRVSALCVKEGQSSQIPDSLIQDANIYELPIIELPSSESFTDLINTITTEIIDTHMLQLQRSLNINYMFIDIAKKGGDILEIAQALSQTISLPVIIENERYDVLSIAIPASESKMYKESELLSANHYMKSHFYIPALARDIYSVYHFPKNSKMGYSFSVAPILYKDSILGNITVVHTSEQVDINDLTLRNAAIFTALSLSAIHSRREKERMIRDGIFMDLLLGKVYTKEDISYWISYFKIDQQLPFAVFLVVPQPLSISKKSYMAFRQLAKDLIRDGYFFQVDTAFVFLKSFREISPKKRKTAVKEYFSRLQQEFMSNSHGIPFYIAASDVCENIYDITEKYRQARIALEIGQNVLPLNSICYYSNLDLYYIFREHPNRQMLVQFSKQYIQPIITRDTLSFDGLATIEAYIECDCSVERCSEVLGLHKNSVKYRINRLRDVLGSDLSDQRYRMKLYLSLIIYKMFPQDFADGAFSDENKLSPPIR